ncbi:MAG: glycyl radical protein [Actinobacteria bacterium]|nr:glycyl radical protein [Actinomycetota bacterium]
MVSKRVEDLKNRVINSKHSISSERARIITKAYKENEDRPVAIKRAIALERILKEMKIEIRSGELIVGNHGEEIWKAPTFPEYGTAFFEKELDDFAVRPIEEFIIDDRVKQELKEIFPYWKGKTHEDRVNSYIKTMLPEKILKYYDFNGKLNQVLTVSSHISVGEGHIIPNFGKVIEKGFKGIKEEVKQELKLLDVSHCESIKRKPFLESVLICCDAAIKFAERFAERARLLALEEKDPIRKEELRKIAEVCKHVPAQPARSFYEALQAVWFVQLILHIEDNGHGYSLGRFDQYLYPYYKKDIEETKLTRDDVLELVECFWIKCNELSMVRRWSYTQYLSGYQLFQTLTIGGQTPDGEDATNDLSYICLEATADLKMIHPTTVVRLHKNTPDDFLLFCCESLVRHGGGLPGFFNDQVAIPLLTRLGIPMEEARDWGVVGCCEITVCGKWSSVSGGVNQMNLPKLLELVLNKGVNKNNGSCLCSARDISDIDSYETLVEEIRKQLRYYLKFTPMFDNITESMYAIYSPTPFLSSMVYSCIKDGRDVTEGGPYNSTQFQAQGLITLGNSMAALKKVVFEDKILTLSEVKKALDNDFEGNKGELIRQVLINRAPKYGNDIECVDQVVRQMADLVIEELKKLSAPVKGGWYAPSFQTLSANVPQGMVVGATPDGRKAGEPFADNISPAPGDDINGPTAVVKSCSKLDHLSITNGTILNLKFHPTALKSQESLKKFAALIRTYFDLLGFQVQFNIIDADTLKDAQKYPEKYRGLVVKVAGYSALFYTLDKKLQDQIITRTEYMIC